MLLQNIIRGVLREAAMGDGADAGAGDAPQARQQPAGEKPSVHERLKAFLSAPQQRAEDGTEGDADDAGEGELPAKQSKQVKEPAKPAKATPQEAADDGADDSDASDPEITLTSITELAEQTGLPLDRLLDLAVPARVDGKEAKATIREMLKSYQTDQLLNSKLQTHASEVQAWKTQQQQAQAEFQQNLQRMDAGLQVAQRMLQGEYAEVNWAQLQQTDPAQFAQTLLGFQQRQAMLDQVAKQIGTERQTQQQAQAQQHQAWLTEQKQLLEAKLPEWGDEKTRKAAINEIVEVGGKVYGFNAEDIGKLTDHRDILVLNDAIRWQKLQASKAQVLNKVRNAPKLLKPGSAQSTQDRAGAASNEARAKLRKSGNVRDAAKWLRSTGAV